MTSSETDKHQGTEDMRGDREVEEISLLKGNTTQTNVAVVL